MKKYISTVFLFLTLFPLLNAQNTRKITADLQRQNGNSLPLDEKSLPVSGTKIDTAKVETPSMYVWKITPRLGERVFLPMDTLLSDFHQKNLVDGQSVAMGYLGNIGSPAQSKIFFDRPESSRFIFEDAMYLWRKKPGDQYFMNTKVPYTNVTYLSGGGGQSTENKLQTELSMNMGKKLNVGFDFDYVYSRGFYQYLSNKQMSYDFYASYIGDKYKMHAFFHNNNFTNVENGGISDTLYITNPDAQSVKATGYGGKSLDIPVRMQNTWNKMRGRNLYITNRYDLGNDEEEYVVNDSTKAWRKKANYVPLASAIFTTHYTDQRRSFKSNYQFIDRLYEPYYQQLGQNQEDPKYSSAIDDYMSYYSFKNTAALAMNEGFRNWTKFGLTAFIEYDMRKYQMPGELPGMFERFSDDALTVGGVLSKEKGKYLRYRASGELNLMEGNDYKLEGEIETMLNLFGKNVSAKANAYVKSIRPSFFQRNFSSKYWSWRESETNYDNTNRVYIGGEINLPELSFSKTRISGGVETINNYIYFDKDKLQQQHRSDVQVLSLRLDQNLKYGIFNWDNQIVYQKSSNLDVMPLPELSLYTNLYLTTKIAKVMTLQLGADAHFHTKYYMPGYEPLTMQFYNQKDMELGSFPVVSAYINLHLKYTRFFLMMYNLADGMGNKESFSLYRYPVNPRIFKLGIAWRFNN